MDTLLGVKGKDFVIIAADGCAARSILLYKTDEDKIRQLDSHKLLAQAGPNCDTSRFGEFIEKSMALYKYRNDMTLSTHAAANFMRRELATAIRKGPFQTQILLGGYDEGKGSSLYWMDYMGALQEVNFGAHGYGASFTLSIFDRKFKPGMNEEEALSLIRDAIHELEVRFLIALPSWTIKLVNKDGTKIIETAAPN